MITKKQKRDAKKLSLEVWAYLRDHPEIYDKEDLPDKLYTKISHFEDHFPLCDLFRKICDSSCFCCKIFGCCDGCPLSDISHCIRRSSYFRKWQDAITDKTPTKYASLIHDAIEGWEI
jgi:hypothetical protein